MLYLSYETNLSSYLNDCNIIEKLKNNLYLLPLYAYLSIIGTFLYYYYDFVISFLMYSNYSNEYFESFNQLNLTNNHLSLNGLIFTPTIDNLMHFLDLNSYTKLNNNFFNINMEFINSYPLFIYFGFLFVFSTVISLFCLSYLGLYGVFIINLITIVLF